MQDHALAKSTPPENQDKRLLFWILLNRLYVSLMYGRDSWSLEYIRHRHLNELQLSRNKPDRKAGIGVEEPQIDR